MHIPVYRAGFSVEFKPGEFTLRTRKLYYLVLFAVQVNRRAAFIQYKDHIRWFWRY